MSLLASTLSRRTRSSSQNQAREQRRRLPNPIKVLPQREWEAKKKGLNDQVNRAANLLTNRLGINRSGRELINMGVAATNNFVACVTLINKELKTRHPKPRNEWSTEQFEAASGELGGCPQHTDAPIQRDAE